jgi:hypothetical protein
VEAITRPLTVAVSMPPSRGEGMTAAEVSALSAWSERIAHARIAVEGSLFDASALWENNQQIALPYITKDYRQAPVIGKVDAYSKGSRPADFFHGKASRP